MPTDDAFDWSTEDRYLSNGGNGPLTARILAVTQDAISGDWVAEMEYWKAKGKSHPNAKRFSISVAFLRSEKCGWKLSPALITPLRRKR